MLECYRENFVRLQRLVQFQSQHVRCCVQCNLLQEVLFTIWFIFAQLGSAQVAERTKAPNHSEMEGGSNPIDVEICYYD